MSAMPNIVRMPAAYSKTPTDRLIERLDAESKAWAEQHKASQFPYLAGLLTGTLREKCALVDTYLGLDSKPQAGCQFGTVHAGDAEILVEYEYQAAERPIYNAESPVCGPGCTESLEIIQALINGVWIDPREVFDDRVIERWTQSLIDGMAS